MPLHPADLAVGFAIVGYGVWKSRRPRLPKRIDVNEPFLLNIPAEIRLIIYDFLFSGCDARNLTTFLRPLRTCKQIHAEAFPVAFSRAKFCLPIYSPQGPFLSPRILRLPAIKLSRIRNIEIVWKCHLSYSEGLSRLVSELAHGPLILDQLFVRVDNNSLFKLRLAPVIPEPREYGRYVMEELPLLDNVKSIIFPSPGIENKRHFQLLFAPNKPCIRLGGTEDSPTVDMVSKKLGDWNYTVFREGKDVRRWRLELTHPHDKTSLDVVEE